MKATKKFMAFLLVVAMVMSMCVTTAFADPVQLQLQTTAELSNNMYKYGSIDLDISTEDFIKTFAYGDVVTVDINGHSFDAPVCSNYDDVDANCYLVRAAAGKTVTTLSINYGKIGLELGILAQDGTTFKLADGIELPLDCTITMKEEGGYYDEWDARQLPTRSNDRADYASDAVFANFRNIDTTGMGENVLYRSSSPCNPDIARNTYADELSEAAGVKTFINLADSKETAEGYAGYAESYYSTQNVVFLNLPAAYASDEFKAGLAEGIKHIGTDEGPYLVHCNEGKDRAGIISMVLEALMGASYDEIVADYLETYKNYFFFEEELTATKAASIANSGIVTAMKTLFAVDDPSTADLAAEAAAFLREIGLTDAEILAVKANLGGNSLGDVVILHSNDVHGAIDGYQYIAALKKAYEANGVDVIVADAGDYSQGTCYVSTTKGADAFAMMNAVGYDVATIGNHEFDYGWAQLKANAETAEFELLCADVLENGEPIFDGHTIIEKGGVKIGFFGLETPEAQTKANPALIQGLTFLAEEDMYNCAQDEIDALVTEGADLIIGLVHLGVDAESEPNRSYDLFANITGADLIIDGHSHTVMTAGAEGETIQSTGTAFANIGVVVIEDGEIVDNYLIPAAQFPAGDADVAAASKAIIDRVDAEYGEVFASSAVELNGDKAPNGNRDSETNLGDLITDSMLWAATKEEGSIKVPAENVVAITNGGGIRAWIHAGDITKKDVNTVLPFGNTVALVYVTGAELLEALEASTYCTPTSVGGFPQIAGMKITVKCYNKYDANEETYPDSTYYGPKSINRVTIDSINGKAFDPAATYAVVTNNFCAAGGDTYYAFAAAKEQFDTGIPLDEALMQYITDVLGGEVGAQYTAPQGRIIVLKEELKGKTVILHSNDVHGNIDGYKYIAGLKDYYKNLGANVLLVDAGDYSQGTCYVSTTKGADAITMMNAAGYDYATIGNHEFDYGWAQLKENAKNANFQLLCADVFENGEPIFNGGVVVNKNGVKIGLFGLETPEAQTKANPALIKGLNFVAGEDLYLCAQDQIDALKAKGADVVICLSHLGVDAESEPNRSYDLFANVTDLDMIIDGHSHTVMVKGANNEPIQSTGTAFANVGVVVINNKTKAIEENYLVSTEYAPVNAKVAAAAKTIIDRVDAEYGEVFATSTVALNGTKAPNGNRDSETNLGDLITDAMLWTVGREDGAIRLDVAGVVAVHNGGGVRASIGAGDITKKDVNTVLPFGNTVTLVYMKGSELLEALEASTYCTPTAVGGFPQVSGMELTVKAYKEYDANENTYPGSTYYGPASINRVTIDSIGGNAFDPNATYAVVTNDFLASGGDTYYVFAASTDKFDTGIPLDEALMQYITEELDGTVGEQYAEPQGRVTVLTENPNPFTDVNDGDWFAEAVAIAYDLGLMSGVDEGVFDPYGEMTRCMLVTVLYNLAGEPALDGSWTIPFTDVNEGDWFYAPVVWAYNNGIVSGVDATTFLPSGTVTRLQLTIMVYNYCVEYLGMDAGDLSAVELSFADKDSIPAWAADCVKFCVETEILHGFEDNTFRPDGIFNRAQCATILVNLAELVAK